MNQTKIILDACCGSRMFWFDKQNPLTLFADIRDEEHVLCDGRKLKVHPDVISDFTNMPFQNKSFKMVVFDPPPSFEGRQRKLVSQKIWEIARRLAKDIKERR